MTAITMIAPATIEGAALVALDRITKSRDFWFRHGGLDQHHKADLAKTILNSGKPLDPVLLWLATGEDSTKLILLDGWHRLAAYKAAKWSDAVPAIVLTGDRRAALLAALGGNSRFVLPMTKDERMDAAWRLVREPVEPRFKVREVANLSGVGKRTVDQMRKRWAEMAAASMTPTGEWWRDRRDTPEWEGDPADMFTDEERAKEVTALAKDIRDLLDRRKHPERRILLDSGAVDDAICEALGSYRMRLLADYSGEDGEDISEWQRLARDRDDADDLGDDEPVPAF